MTLQKVVSDPERWILRPETNLGESSPPLMRLICVPYAGGGAAVYHGWAQDLPAVIEPWTLRLPGRDVRMHEQLRTELISTAEEAASALASTLTPPFALFGHSLGALLAFEISRALRGIWGLEPSLLAVSARNAPQRGHHNMETQSLSDDEYLEALDLRYGAIPPAIRDDPEMRALYLPILRADTTMLETYHYRAGQPLSCPVLAWGGLDDPETSFDSLDEWRELTTAGCTTEFMPGGHFFLQEQRRPLLDRLSSELLRTLVP